MYTKISIASFSNRLLNSISHTKTLQLNRLYMFMKSRDLWHDKFQLPYHSHSFKVIFRGFHDNLSVEKFKECLKKFKKI